MTPLRSLATYTSLCVGLAGCGGGQDGGTTDAPTSASATTPTDASASSDSASVGATVGSDSASTSAGPTTDPSTASDSAGTGDIKYDVGAMPDAGGQPDACGFDPHAPCDDGDADPFRAMGLNCPGEAGLQVTGSTLHADPLGMTVLPGFGEGDTYKPTEGARYTVLSTGEISELFEAPDSPGDAAYHCNSWLPLDGMDTTSFPPPIVKDAVGGDCLQSPALVGTGDCSNTIEDQFNQSGFKYDYQEIRFTTTVPAGATTLSFDVAFMTNEYPVWLDKPYNDMFLAWLEAANWTGNISFDPQGHALSLNAAFFEFFDESGDLPQFAGTCMRYSAGTPWLTTTAPVVPGDSIELVFAIFDVEDVNWDSLVFLDNFRWGCDEQGEGPVTMPPE